VNEITQLRSSDVRPVDGIPCIRITPEAGTVKTSRERTVPLHPHLREQGFLIFARSNGDAPLFYSVARQRNTERKNPTFASVGSKIAEWVRGLGVTDKLVAPNHGWRHRFRTIARKVRMDAKVRDAIQGHAPRTEAEDYGEVPPDVMLHEILKMPRYEVSAGARRDRRRHPKPANS
jgi:integrase